MKSQRAASTPAMASWDCRCLDSLVVMVFLLIGIIGYASGVLLRVNAQQSFELLPLPSASMPRESGLEICPREASCSHHSPSSRVRLYCQSLPGRCKHAKNGHALFTDLQALYQSGLKRAPGGAD